MKQWAPSLGLVPQPPSLLRLGVRRRRREGQEWLQAEVLLTEDHCVVLRSWLWHPVGDQASVRGHRAAFRTSKHNTPRRSAGGACVHNETETHTHRQTLQQLWREGNRGEWWLKERGSRGRPTTAASRPLLWEHTEPNEFDSLLSSINHAMQNISPL